MWTINPIDPECGPRFYTVSATTDGNEIRFTVESEFEARKLRDTLNQFGTAVSTFAL